MSIDTSSPFEHRGRADVGIEEWCETHGLISELLPFSHRKIDPWEVLGGLREGFDQLPKTCKTTKIHNESSPFDLPGGLNQVKSYTSLAELAGTWQYDPQRERDRRWVNPNYIHLRALDNPITDEQRRVETIKRLADYGVFSLSDIAPRFGWRKVMTCQFAQQHGIQWGDRRARGKRRMARTVETTARWTDRTRKDCAQKLGVPPTTLLGWIHGLDDFEVPDEPLGEPWFKPIH